eukprot:330429_1
MPQLRTNPLNPLNNFDNLLQQRRNAFINNKFDIMDIDINSYLRIKVKLSDLTNGNSANKFLKRTDKNDDDSEGVSILQPPKIRELFSEYQTRAAQVSDNTNQNDHLFQLFNDQPEYQEFIDSLVKKEKESTPEVIKENLWPFLNFDVLKCKWIDNDNNIHFEYFKLYSINEIVNIVINQDTSNHPFIDNWCVKYEFEYDNADDIFIIKSKSLDYDLFWSCCLYFHIFKTCGLTKYDKDFKQLINSNNINSNISISDKKQMQTFYHNSKHNFIPKSIAKKEHVCSYDCSYMDEQQWFLVHGKKIMKSKPCNINDPFYIEMINRKKCVLYGDFKVIDRYKVEEYQKDISSLTKQDIEYFNIFNDDNVKKMARSFKQNNKFICYEHDKVVRNNCRGFDLEGYDSDHRCVAIWTDDNGKIHEEWFKLDGRGRVRSVEDKISSIYWFVEYRMGSTINDSELVCYPNEFWTMATMLKVFGICGVKQIDEEFYELKKRYKYLVFGYVNEMNKGNTLFSTISISLCEMILKYHPVISGSLSKIN